MTITVKLFATLRHGRFDQSVIEGGEDMMVRHVVALLNIPEKEAAILFINSRHAELDTVLHEGDTLAIFPPVGGG
jgi:sulfur-carrier protein